MWVYRSNRNDAAQLPRSLNDLDFSAVNLNYALNAGLDPKKALLLEGADTNWNLVFAVRAKNKDTPPQAVRRTLSLPCGQGLHRKEIQRNDHDRVVKPLIPKSKGWQSLPAFFVSQCSRGRLHQAGSTAPLNFARTKSRTSGV